MLFIFLNYFYLFIFVLFCSCFYFFLFCVSLSVCCLVSVFVCLFVCRCVALFYGQVISCVCVVSPFFLLFFEVFSPVTLCYI